jgi:hypothetical protein
MFLNDDEITQCSPLASLSLKNDLRKLAALKVKLQGLQPDIAQQKDKIDSQLNSSFPTSVARDGWSHLRKALPEGTPAASAKKPKVIIPGAYQDPEEGRRVYVKNQTGDFGHVPSLAAAAESDPSVMNLFELKQWRMQMLEIEDAKAIADGRELRPMPERKPRYKWRG